jgi:hypothetical protein
MRIIEIPFDRVLGNPAVTIHLIEENDLDDNLELRQLMPDILEGTNVTLFTYQKLNSLKNFPKVVKGDVDLSRTNLSNLKGIGKDWLKECGWLFLPPNITSNILGLLRIKGLKGICFKHSQNGFQADEQFTKAMEIINWECKPDFMDCIEVLTHNQLREYAGF